MISKATPKYLARSTVLLSGDAFSGGLSRVFYVLLHQYFLPGALVTVGSPINPYKRHFSLNHEVWVDL